MKGLFCFYLFSSVLVAIAFAADSNVTLGEDVISCLNFSNLTAEEVMNMTFFNSSVTIPHNAKCFGACLIATDYNVSVTPEGIVEKEDLLISAILDDKDMDLANATDVLDTCKSIMSPERDGCENIYNYATCVNEIYFEKKGIKNYSGNILDQCDYQNETSSEPPLGATAETANPNPNM